MKKIFQLLLGISFFLSFCFLFSSCRNSHISNSNQDSSTSDIIQEKHEYIIDFIAIDGGEIIGEDVQIVKEGESSKAVTAKAKEGYFFEGWGDHEFINVTDETIIQDERIIENVCESKTYIASFAKKTYQMNYHAGENGKIEGEQHQQVKYEEDGTSITAIADKGYRFLCWSDGIDTPIRKDINVKDNIEVTAYFEIISYEYQYNYKYATSNCDVEKKTLTYGRLNEEKLIVPVREHCTFLGWYADKEFEIPVSDEKGNLLIDDTFFYNNECQEFYAKWKPNHNNTYKLLIIYVTEINGRFVKDNAESVEDRKQINYKMNETERRICHMVTNKVRDFLNDLSLTHFQVDEYFTTIPITDKDSVYLYSLMAYNIPEVKDMLSEYSSVLVSYSANDFDNEMHNASGSAGPKYGSINFESGLEDLIINHEPIENLLDENFWRWDNFVNTYIHEFIHTIEMKVHTFEYHKTLDSRYNSESELCRLYLLNQAIVEVQEETTEPKVGIPYEFWEGKVAKIYYEAEEGGYISHSFNVVIDGLKSLADCQQYVIYGYDALSVRAKANDGYEFIGWSDGVMEAERTDLNVTQDMYIVAKYRKIEENSGEIKNENDTMIN